MFVLLSSVILQYPQPKVVSFFVIYKGGWLSGDTLNGGNLYHNIPLNDGFGFRDVEMNGFGQETRQNA